MSERGQAGSILARFRDIVDVEIRRSLQNRPGLPLYEMIGYHLGLDQAGAETPSATGKRVRAALCCLASEAVGGRVETVAPAAAAVELVHSFTLVHDDVADQDATRRGRPAVWCRWGIAHAIIAGDALFSLANVVATRLGAHGVSADQTAAVLEELNEATLRLCEGQQMDISHEGRADITVEDYRAMIERKTAGLFGAACAIGARVGGGSQNHMEAFRRFGRDLGLAFQIRDDVLGIWGEATELGKPVGSDLQRNKRSLPIVHALRAADEAEGRELRARLSAGVSNEEEARRIATQMQELGSRDLCEQMAREYLARGIQALDDIGLREGPAEDLRILATYLVERTH